MSVLMRYVSDLRAAWSGDSAPSRTVCAHHPLRCAHVLAETLSGLLLQRMGRFCPPFRDIIDPPPLGQFCELALLRNDAVLAAQLRPLLAFSSLWCREKQYGAPELCDAIELLRRAFGWEKRREVQGSYFRALERELPHFDQEGESQSLCELSWSYGITSARVQCGDKVPMGAMAIGDELIVPAFGPQGYPLNHPETMGVSFFPSHKDWACASIDPDVWMQIQGNAVRFVGLKPTTPLAFVFYVRAVSAQIGKETFVAKSLRRYQGPSQRVVFARPQGEFFLESSPCKMELIPLSGGREFWAADFLSACEVAVHDPHMSIESGTL